ncbi:uncharacterized protein LOC144666877 [Oculina patagonica]
MHVLFQSADFASYVCAIFDTSTHAATERAVAVQLSTSIYWKFVRHLVSLVRRRRENDEIPFSVEEMSSVGKAKVRHVGGWAVRKILTRYRKYVQRNMFSTNSATQSNVEKQQKLCELLEENIIIPYAKLEEVTKYPETLEVTEARQYRGRGLLHISDEAYLFFIHLEGRRVELLNQQRLQEEMEKMVETAMRELARDGTIKVNWRRCFVTRDAEGNTDLLETMLGNLLFYYLNMGTSQFLRDFRRAHQVKKSVELRKRVLQRQERTKERTDKLPFEEIVKDRSNRKHVSHGRLAGFIEKHKDAGLGRAYLKSKLILLCEAYNVQVSSRSTKLEIARKLAEAVRLNTYIPFISPVDD